MPSFFVFYILSNISCPPSFRVCHPTHFFLSQPNGRQQEKRSHHRLQNLSSARNLQLELALEPPMQVPRSAAFYLPEAAREVPARGILPALPPPLELDKKRKRKLKLIKNKPTKPSAHLKSRNMLAANSAFPPASCGVYSHEGSTEPLGIPASLSLGRMQGPLAIRPRTGRPLRPPTPPVYGQYGLARRAARTDGQPPSHRPPPAARTSAPAIPPRPGPTSRPKW